MLKRLLFLIIILAFIAIQFVPVELEVPTVNEGKDIFTYVDAPAEVKSLITNACYDCHSFRTIEPWYASFAPVSWWLENHIKEGRRHLNFTLWADYDHEKQIHKLEEAFEELEQGEMPLSSYTWVHEDAKLTEEQRSTLVAWFRAQHQKLSDSGGIK